MSNIKSTMNIAAAAVLLFAGSAFAAATAFAAPAAGNAPYFDGVTATASQLQRADVEAQAAAHLPAAGQFSARALGTQGVSDLTRAEVESNIDVMPAAGEAA